MFPFKAIKLILPVCFFIPLAVQAQYKFDKAVYVNKDNGFLINSTGSIRKDSNGFVWIGTVDGLCRFDGQQIKVFREGSDLRHSLFENTIHTVITTRNYVWMGTKQGLSVLNTRDYTFRHYQFSGYKKADSLKRRSDQSVPTLYCDRSGNIWVGASDRGLCMYDEAKDDFHFYSLSREKYPPLKPSLGPETNILSIEASKTNDSIVWAGTPAGLLEVNKYANDVRIYSFPQKNTDYQIALNAFRRLYHHDDGLLYVGSWAAGVNVFDPVSKAFTPLEVKSEMGKKILNSTITGFLRKSDHEIWVTTGAGLAIYDTRLKDVTWTKFSRVTENEFYGISFIDETNRVWWSDINGVQYFDPVMQQFSRYSFKDLSGPNWAFAFYILSDSSGNNITICPRQTDAIYHFDKLKKEWTKKLFPNYVSFQKEIEAIRGFIRLPSGDYVISANKGIFIYSEKNNTLAPIRAKRPLLSNLRGAIILDHSGYIWLPDDAKGLIKWKPETDNYIVYKNRSLQSDTSNSRGRLTNLFADSRDNIWFQMTKGFGVYVAAKDSILTFPYSQNETNSFNAAHSFAEDKKGRVWISAGDGWLGYALTSTPENGIVYKLNIRDKGISGNLFQLTTDNNGEIWGYTPKELIKMNSDNLSFSTYSFQYGGDEPDFYHFSFLPSGEMIFGGRNDITIANPAELKRNKEIPVPYIDELAVLNQPLNLNPDGLSLRLKYNQNFFSIGFSALAFTMAKDVKFRYRLNGFDDWTEVTGRRFVNYTNVPGGNYTFQLQAANNEGIWNEKMLELPVYIATAFWKTTWFRIAILLAVAFTVYWLYQHRIDQVRKKQKLKSEYEKKLANVEMSALLAQMNPHFLFNSLNSIDSYIIRNESKKASEYLNNFARLMRLILQNSRSNYISLKDELEALELYLEMESLRFKNKFSYSITIDKELDSNLIVIPPMLIQPYIENAIWHGLMHKTNGEEGKVELFVSKYENNLLCVVRDNGIGRKKAAELKDQKQSSHKRSMGMQITEDRIEIINKLYDINTSVNIYDMENDHGQATGTRVELRIPI